MNFHGRNENIPCSYETVKKMAQESIDETGGLVDAAQRAYRYGHRDARHAAAEIATEADRMIADNRVTFDQCG